MNKAKQVERQKYLEAIKGMNPEERRNYDLLLKLQKQFDQLVKELHVKLFSEEYDYIYDDYVEAVKRKKGENPMSEDCIKRIDAKRETRGFLPLSKNGYAQDSEATLEYCIKLITGEVKL